MDAKPILPDDFEKIYNSGILHPTAGIRMSQFSWLTREGIATFQGPPYLSDRLVPFALSPAGDRFGWWKSVDGKGYDYVVLSPNDCDSADVYSPTFTAFLFRIMLDEFCDCWFSLQDGGGPETAAAIMRENVRLLQPQLPDQWHRVLTDVLSRKPVMSNAETVAWMKKSEADQILARELAFPMLNTQVQQYF